VYDSALAGSAGCSTQGMPEAPTLSSGVDDELAVTVQVSVAGSPACALGGVTLIATVGAGAGVMVTVPDVAYTRVGAPRASA
jgi:hypothetical protein